MNAERRSFRRRTDEPDVSAVLSRCPSRQREAEARAAVCRRAGRITAVEALEYVRLGLRRNARPVVADGDRIAVLPIVERDPHESRDTCVANGVVDEVGDEATHEIFVT